MKDYSFYLKSRSKTACLLIHGFTGSPEEMLPLGDYIRKKGPAVHCPVLPGHCTKVSDLDKVSWRDWFNTVADSYKMLKNDYDNIAVVGLSMGGTLALHLAAHYPVKCLVGLSTSAESFHPAFSFVSMLKHIKSNYPKKNEAARLDSWFNYNSYSLHGMNELASLLKHTRRELPEVTVPYMGIHSIKDTVVPVESGLHVYDWIASENKRFITLNESGHVITMDTEQKKVFREVYKFVKQN